MTRPIHFLLTIICCAAFNPTQAAILTFDITPSHLETFTFNYIDGEYIGYNSIEEELGNDEFSLSTEFDLLAPEYQNVSVGYDPQAWGAVFPLITSPPITP